MDLPLFSMVDGQSVQSFAGIPVHPGVDASAKEEDDWWRQFDAVLNTTDAVHFIAGVLPPRLEALKVINISGMTEIAVPEASSDLKGHISATTHNSKLREKVAENARRDKLVMAARDHSAQSLAVALDAALRPKSSALLLKLQELYKDATRSAALSTTVYDGHSFVLHMRADRKVNASAPSKARSYEWHEEQYRIMLNTKLPDGCSSQEYTEKCSALKINHLPYFKTVVLKGETLADVFLKFLPAALEPDRRSIISELAAAGKLDDPDEAMERAARRVGLAADPAREHARLACAVAPMMPQPLPAAPAPAPPPPPPAASGQLDKAAVTKEVERAVAAALGQAPPSKRKQKADERKGRGKLPEGQLCKAGTCNLDHDVKYPGKPCYRDPRVAIQVPYEVGQSERYMERLKAARLEQAKLIEAKTGQKLVPKPVTVGPKGEPAPKPVAPVLQSGFDGLDDFNDKRVSLADVARGAGMHPVLPGSAAPSVPVVAGVPVSFSMAELADLENYCEDAASDGSAEEDVPDLVEQSNSSADETYESWGDGWWFLIESIKGDTREVRLLSRAEWDALDADGWTLQSFGPGVVAEMKARKALVEGRPYAEWAEMATPAPAAAPSAMAATPPAPPPAFSHAEGCALIEALRPDSMSAAHIKSTIQRSGLARTVVSPQIGGDRGRTKLTLIDEARHAFGLVPLVEVDPDSVRRHAANIPSNRVPLGSPVPDAGGSRDPPQPSIADVFAAASEGGDAGPMERPQTPLPEEPAAADAMDSNAGGSAVPLAGITVVPLVPPLPSMAAVGAFVTVSLMLLALVVAMYVLGAPATTLAGAPLALTQSPGGFAAGWRQAVVGGGVLADRALRAPVEAPVGLLAITFSVAILIQQFIDCEGWHVLRFFGILISRCIGRIWLRFRQWPGYMRGVQVVALTFLFARLINLVLHGVDAAPTAARVQHARALLDLAPLPSEALTAVRTSVQSRNNVAFVGNFLPPEATSELACDLGMKDPKSITLWDTGAAINASVGHQRVESGSIMPNHTYVSTANGLCLPPSKCTQLVPVATRGKGLRTIPLRDSVILEDCAHTLAAGGKLAAEDGIGLLVAPLDGDSYLFTSWDDRASDIPLINLGVLIVPDPEAKPAHPISHGHIQNDATRTGKHIFQTFNHRKRTKLSKMPDCTHAPEAWGANVEAMDDVASLRANAKRVPVQGHVPAAKAPGDCMSLDGWTNQTPHIHGGQRNVLNTVDLYSELGKSYLMHAKSDAGAALETHLSWNHSLGVRYSRAHTDNAGDLIKGEAGETFKRWGVHVTTCSPEEARQNGKIERRHRTNGEDARVALEQANFLEPGAGGESYWWYAWRDAEMKSWCIPFKRNGAWTCPWLLHTGSRPNPTVYRPFGMECYAKEYHPTSKTALRGRECRVLGYSQTQKGWLLLEVPSRKKFVSPHVHFVWGSFPGLRPAKQGGRASSTPVDSPTEASPDAAAAAGDSTAQPSAPPPAAGDREPEHSDESDGSDDEGGGSDLPIAQRLSRARRQAAPYDGFAPQGGSLDHPHARQPVSSATTEMAPHSLELKAPDGDFLLYLFSGGNAGEGSVVSYAREVGLYVVAVDIELGGYAHDIMHEPIRLQIMELADLPLCVAIFSAVPCGSWSVLRYRPSKNAPGVERRLPDQKRGIKRADGSVAPSVTLGNTALDLSIEASTRVISHGGEAAWESPVSRAKHSQFAIEGREDHAAMWDDDALIDHLAAGRYSKLVFDQCCTRVHPCTQKTTQLAATPRLYAALRKRFGHLRCSLPASKHISVTEGPNDDGQFASEKLAKYSPKMNEMIVESVVEVWRQGLAHSGGPFPRGGAKAPAPPLNLAGRKDKRSLLERELQIFNDAGYTIKLHAPDFFLGCNIEPGPTLFELGINMRAYVTKLAEKHLPRPLESYPIFDTPSTKQLFQDYEQAIKREKAPSAELLQRYGSKCGAAIYGAPATRFDSAYSIGICARCVTCPTEAMDAHLDRILAYQAQHADVGMRFNGKASGADVLKFYSDSDWAVGHSTTGWGAIYGGSTVGYGSKRQVSIALSSTEAEIMAASLASCELIFMRGLLREMGADMSEPTILFVDNAGAVALAKDRKSCQRSRHIERRYLKVREWVAHGEVRVMYVPTDENAADLLTKSLEVDSFERHREFMSGASRAASPKAVAMAMALEAAGGPTPMGDWEAFYAGDDFAFVEGTEVDMLADGVPLAQDDPLASRLVSALALAAGSCFAMSFFMTPFGTGERSLVSAMPIGFEGDDPTLREAAASADRAEWEQCCIDEHDNLESHNAFEYVREDTLPTWCPRRRRASEVCDTLWVLKQKRGSKNEKTKKKGRICYNGAMQKATAARSGRVIDTFAPTVRHTTFKLLGARGCVEGRPRWQFDVEGAYLKGKFEDGEVVYARPPPDFPGGVKFRFYEDGVPLVWRLLTPLYGEADAGRIWNRTAVKQLVDVQGFTQSEFDPCYFYKTRGDERADIALYVDDGYTLG